MSYIRDIAVICGATLVIYGVWQMSAPAACIAGGLTISTAAFLWSWMASKRGQQ